jgi:hypothetical protein
VSAPCADPDAGPSDPAARRRWAAERRAAARRHHPDRGGSTDALLEAYARVDARHGLGRGAAASPGAGPLVEVLPPSWWRRLARRLADGADRARRPSTRWIDVTGATARPRENAPRHRARHGGPS